MLVHSDGGPSPPQDSTAGPVDWVSVGLDLELHPPNPPQLVLMKPVLVSMDTGPSPPESSAGGPVETRFFWVWTWALVLVNPSQRVLTKPALVGVDAGPPPPEVSSGS